MATMIFQEEGAGKFVLDPGRYLHVYITAMQIKLKISILNDQGFQAMGPGPLRLLEKIGEHQSINKAAKSMELSYVKALKMLSFLEKDMGRVMVIRTKGGNNRGGTRLTPFAEIYIQKIRKLEEKINHYAEREFNRFETRLQGMEITHDL